MATKVLNIGNSSSSITVDINENGNLLPQVTGTYNIGSSDKKWNNIYGTLKGTADNADTLDTYHATAFYKDRGALIENNGYDANNLNPGFYLVRGTGYGQGTGAAHANFNGVNTNFANLIGIQLSTPAWGGSLSFRHNWGSETQNGNNGWSNWLTLLDASNYNSYCPTLTGTGATGTWGISISGSASSLTTARSIWGQSFNGTADVSGDMYNIGGLMRLSSTNGRFSFLMSDSSAAPISVKSMFIGTSYNNTDTANYIVGDAGRIYFGGNFHLDSLGSNATYINYYTGNNIYLCSGSSQGSVGIGTSSPSYKLHVIGDIYANGGWLRSSGSTGWYNESYGGGMYMIDSTYVRVYNAKRFYNSCSDAYSIYTDGSFATTRTGGCLSIYNGSSWYEDCMYNHKNGNLSLDAPGGSLYISYFRGNTYFGGGTYYIDRAGYFNGSCASCSNSDTLDGYHESSFLRYSGWWTSGSGQNVDDASGMIFAYSSHSLPGTWGVVTTFDYQKDSNYRHQIYGDGWNNVMYFRTKSADRGGWNSWRHLWAEGDAVTSAVWNDYAEYREADTIEAGRCVYEVGDDSLALTTKRLQKGCSITSDTWGFAEGKTEKAQTPIAVSGRVLAYPYENRDLFKPGEAVCSGPNGTVSLMTDEEVQKYPLAIIGTVSCVPDYEEWGGGEGADRDPVKVNGRIWIRVR